MSCQSSDPTTQQTQSANPNHAEVFFRAVIPIQFIRLPGIAVIMLGVTVTLGS